VTGQVLEVAVVEANQAASATACKGKWWARIERSNVPVLARWRRRD